MCATGSGKCDVNGGGDAPPWVNTELEGAEMRGLCTVEREETREMGEEEMVGGAGLEEEAAPVLQLALDTASCGSP